MKTLKHLPLPVIILTLILSLLPITHAGVTSTSQGEQNSLASSQLDQPVPLTPDTLETFLDTFFAEHMETAHIPGATIVFVKDGQILLTKGYGVAKVETQLPVAPPNRLPSGFHLQTLHRYRHHATRATRQTRPERPRQQLPPGNCSGGQL